MGGNPVPLAAEVCSRLASRGILTLRWVPSHSDIEGNEVADDWAKMAAESPLDAVPRDYLRETSFAHMTRRATEARSAGVEKWIGDHVKNKHRYTPPKGPQLCKELRHERKALAGRYTSSCRGMQRLVTNCAKKATRCRLTSASGAVRTRSRLVTTFS